MPEKKTGQCKKAEKQKLRQKEIRSKEIDFAEYPCNAVMECKKCQKKQKSRAFCYFCQALQRLPICAQCGKIKYMLKTVDCVLRHPGVFTTGLGMVGAMCDYCEAWICHGRKCLQILACHCPLKYATCVECERGVWEHGGRIFKCSFCLTCRSMDEAHSPNKTHSLAVWITPCSVCKREGREETAHIVSSLSPAEWVLLSPRLVSNMITPLLPTIEDLFAPKNSHMRNL